MAPRGLLLVLVALCLLAVAGCNETELAEVRPQHARQQEETHHHTTQAAASEFCEAGDTLCAMQGVEREPAATASPEYHEESGVSSLPEEAGQHGPRTDAELLLDADAAPEVGETGSSQPMSSEQAENRDVFDDECKDDSRCVYWVLSWASPYMPTPCTADQVRRACPVACARCIPPPSSHFPPPPASTAAHQRSGPMFPQVSRVVNVGTSLSAALAVTADHPLVLVYLYAPWCGNSRRVSAYVQQAAEAAERDLPSAVLVAMDCWTPGECAATNKLQYFPQFLTYMRGLPSAPYYGGTSPWELTTHLARMTTPILAASTVMDLVDLLKTSEVAVVLGLPDVSDPSMVSAGHGALHAAAVSLQAPDLARGRIPVALAVDPMLLVGLDLPSDREIVAVFCMHDIEKPVVIHSPFVDLAKRVNEIALSCKRVTPLNAWNYADHLFTNVSDYLALLMLPLNQSAAVTVEAREFVAFQHALALAASLPSLASVRFATFDCTKFPELSTRLGAAVTSPHLVLVDTRKERVAFVADAAILTNSSSLFDVFVLLLQGHLAMRPVPLRPAHALSTSLPQLGPHNMTLLREQPRAAVLFHAPWCAFCKTALVVAERVAPTLPIPLFLYNIDAGPPQTESLGLPTVSSLPLVVVRTANGVAELPLRMFTAASLGKAINSALLSLSE